ncbi:uncharacterized protein LOC109835110 [Asparagus officinalis]|uniref:uncharacterized protein LOC109835110 n=1 Tax=Asparagus officinalis TaxID=4686 RepID=UPI00098E2DCB|nr:uncharacterized protein LOC109835110 [Asparagus officinalis]
MDNILDCVILKVTEVMNANLTCNFSRAKVKQPKCITKFRSIFVCNVLYKIASKALANRLKKVLPKIISTNQSAFTLERLIADNVLVTFEAMHCMKSNKPRCTQKMAVKLDMSKAYDSFEWDYLQAMMLKLGFAESWVRLVT